jgi:hypothetical protein
MVTAFRQGLQESGYVEGRNVTIEYRWADDVYERLPALASELVQRRVAVLVAAGSPAARSPRRVSLQKQRRRTRCARAFSAAGADSALRQERVPERLGLYRSI